MKSMFFSLVAVFSLLLVTSCDESSDGPSGATGAGASALEVSGDDLGLLTINSGGKIVSLHFTNNSSSPVEDLQIKDPFYPLGFQGGVFPGTSGNCSAILAPQTSCSVALEIASWSSTGSYSQELKYSFKSGGTVHEKSVDVKAQFEDGKRLLTGDVTFVGMVNVGSSKIEQLSLHNPSSFNNFINVSLKLKSGSGFTLKNPGNCDTIRPLDTCKVDIEFAPTASASLDETLTIAYQVLGKKLSESVQIKATANDIEHISSNGTHNFGAKVTDFNQPGTIKLTLRRDAASFSDVSDITLGSLMGTGLSVDSTTCSNPGMILNGTNDCDIVFKTTIPLKTTTAINQNIEIKYKVGAVSKQTTLTLNGSLLIVPLRLHATSAHNFGTKAVAHAGSTLITIVVDNHSTSSIPIARNFKLTGKKGGALALPLATGPGQTTCTGATNLARGNTCQFVVRATPAVSINNFSKNLTIKYKVGTEDISLPVTVQGNFNVLPPGFVGSPGIDIIGFAGHQNFGPVNVVAGNSFDVSLTLTNTSVADTASTFQIERYDPAGTTIMPWPGYFIQYSNTKSTCLTGGPIAAGANCTIVLEITPAAGFATNLGAGRKFKVSYTDAGGNAHNQDVDVTGTWNFVPAPVTPPPAPWAENINIPLIIDSTTAAHEYYSYVKRPVKPSTGLTAALLNLFPQSAWNLIPTGTVTNVNHMVFTFETTPQNQLVKLKDIVPDRIVDTATGKRYVLMYHGSTSDFITGIFDLGSSAIRFNAANITAFGQGFYLASNPNESKNYACDRRNGGGGGGAKPPHIQPILLIIGVQEEDAIKGRRSHTDLGTNQGDPTDPNIYFRRTTTSHNQFVFYSNAKPYLRIFKIIKLAKNHGMANGYDDGDGTPDPTPAGMIDPNMNPAYRCTW